MADVKHADGEWTFDEDNFTIVADGTAVLADVMDFDDFPCLDPDEVDEQAFNAQCVATGRVMAAGSAMLEALQDIIKHFEEMPVGPDLADAIRVFGKQAVAKATVAS